MVLHGTKKLFATFSTLLMSVNLYGQSIDEAMLLGLSDAEFFGLQTRVIESPEKYSGEDLIALINEFEKRFGEVETKREDKTIGGMETGGSQWEIKLEKDDLTDDASGLATKLDTNNNILFIACNTSTKSITTGVIFSSTDYYRGELTYRVDDNEAVKAIGASGTNIVSIGSFPDGNDLSDWLDSVADMKKMLAEMLGGDVIKARGMTHDFKKTDTLNFVLDGINMAFSDACSWHDDFHDLSN